MVGFCAATARFRLCSSLRLVLPCCPAPQVCRGKRIPVIFDEVFTGLYRIGAESAAHLLSLQPDIACYGKLLTGGTVPMAVTLSTEEVFEAFSGPSKVRMEMGAHGGVHDALPSSASCTHACSPW